MTTFPKPVKGAARAERVERRQQLEAKERRHKSRARKRDGYTCRVPRCDWRQRRDRLEVAHLEDKGMGGDHGQRSGTAQLLTTCLQHHQGRPSLHSQELRVEPLTRAGADGPCEFFVREYAVHAVVKRPRWRSIGRELYVGIVEREA